MLSALLNGKLSREQENMEDILTSTVFDVLKYLPPDQGILPFLARASSPDGKQRPFADAGIAGAQVDYSFWPTYRAENCNPCEPDLCLQVRLPAGIVKLVFVEAKYLSGKSSEDDDGDDIIQERRAPPADQLAREWQNLASVAREQRAEPVLIYLTAGVGCPREDIEASRVSVNRVKQSFNCLWLSWRHLHEITSQSSCLQLRELNRLLERLNLVFFRGIQFKVMPEIDWRFFSEVRERSRMAKNVQYSSSTFDFSFAPVSAIKWRFSR
jgi:hypothetical protein